MGKYNLDSSPFPEVDSTWTEDDWKNLLENLIANGIVNYQQVTSLVLGFVQK